MSMTFREKYMEEHPNIDPSEAVNMGCPCDFGYEPETNDCPDGIRTCSICWDREIPEEKPTIEKVNPLVDVVSGPVILDSGNRRQFESGAVRDIQEGKGRCDLLPLDVVAEYYSIFYERDNSTSEVFHYISEFVNIGAVSNLYEVLNVDQPFDNSFDMFLQVAIHFEEGAKKYGENNWQKGIPVHCYIDSAVRHYLKFLRGDKDEPHDRAFCWNIMCAIWTCKHKPELNEYAVKEEV